MADEKKFLSNRILSNPPHIKDNQSIKKVMWFVILALLPSNIYAVYLFGLSAFFLLLVSVICALTAETFYQLLMKKPLTYSDGSAVITGLLIAMNVPPEAPLWMAGIGAFFAIIIVKQLFGGLGFNIFNPALAARAFMIASWPVEMTTKWSHFTTKNVLASGLTNKTGLPVKLYDAITQATPLSALKEIPDILSRNGVAASADKVYDLLFSADMIRSLFQGNIGGCLGETSAVLLLLGGIFLLYKRIITWHTPAAFIGTVAVIMFLYYSATGFEYPLRAVLFHLFSAGLFLGAFFMATDMVTTPVTAKGMIIFGVGCGIITSVIRLWGGYPEGVSYSILLMNATVPLIDKYTKPKVFGT
ncbi:MAG: RnfABCDGE type electron transport complex subunit D [Spirochaetes bacterium]|nr:RnfABCDGE type electron transport complex subunit D [Spirochaetota bacterium]